MRMVPLLPNVVAARGPSRILPRERPSVKASDVLVVTLRRLPAAVTLAALLVLGASSCAPHASPAAPSRLIRIATQSPFSERYVAEGQALMLAVRLAVDELGGALRKHGLDVEVVNYDDRASVDAGLAMVSPSSTHPDLTNRGMTNVFRVCGRDDVQADLAARFIRQSLRART